MERVLDIGAGYDPHPDATDAIDITDRDTLIELGSLDGQTIPRRISYKYEVDMNDALPYPARTFHRVVSKFSLITFGRPKAYREIYRVLKPGGLIEVWVGSAQNVAKGKRHLKGAGFIEVNARFAPGCDRKSQT